MDFLGYVGFVRRSWMLIVNCVALSIIGASLINLFQPQTFEASAVSYVRVSSLSGTSQDLTLSSGLAESRIPTYLVLARTPEIFEGVAALLPAHGLTPDQVEDRVRVSRPEGSQVITFTATGHTPAAARDLANAAQTHFAAVVTRMETSGSRQATTVSLETVSPARAPAFAVAPRPRMNIAKGALAGLILSVLFVFVRYLRRWLALRRHTEPLEDVQNGIQVVRPPVMSHPEGPP